MSATDFGHATISFAAYLFGKWIGRKQAIKDALHANREGGSR